MARKSRKQAAVQQDSAVHKKFDLMKLALYIRLSIEDNGGKGRDSIHTQQALLMDFAQRVGPIESMSTYVDNGWTGTDLHRPGWEQLMEDVRAKRIDCIIVKDLSRFARNYLEAGDCLEKIFPFLGVRFIAVNDQYDSAGILFPPKDLIVEFKNLANDYYSRDISKKILSAFQTKKARGEFLGSAPYGYIKEDGHFVIDEPAAAVVRRIFAMTAEGVSFCRIAKILNQEGIASPKNYMKERGIKKYTDCETILWRPGTVSRIAYDRTYTGDRVQGKYNESIYSKEGRGRKREDEWEIIPDAHAAIVDRKTFEKVQEIKRANQKAYRDRPGEGAYGNVLQGILFCGVCGRPIKRNKSIDMGKRRYSFYCPSIYDRPDPKCSRHMIADHKILDLVLEQIRLQIDLAVEIETFLEQMGRSGGLSKMHGQERIRLDELRKERERWIYRRMELYGKMKKGILTREEFLDEKERYSLRISALEKEMQEQQRKVASFGQQISLENRWLKAFLAFRNAKELTRDMAASLLKRVELYKDGRIHIQFDFQDAYGYLMEAKELGEGADHGREVSG